MRTSTLSALLVAGLAGLVALPAAAMFKCTARDGTVLYQARPCSAGDREASVASGPTSELRRLESRSPQEVQERAVQDRELAQRRARCGAYRDTIERQKPVLDSPNEVTRQHAATEIKNQERRMRDDQCAAI